jgi:hypothetical protein
MPGSARSSIPGLPYASAVAPIRLDGPSRIKQILERRHADKRLIPALLSAFRPKII